MKKLITVCWSTTVEKEIPEGVDIDEIGGSWKMPEAETKLTEEVLKEAWMNVQCKDGEITDIQDI